MNRLQAPIGPIAGISRLVLIASVGLLSSGTSVFAQEDTFARRYDVRALQTAALQDPEGVDLRLPLSTSWLDDMEPDRHDLPLEDALELTDETWPQLLTGALGADRTRNGFSVEVRSGFLSVYGSTDTHARVERLLADLSAHLLQTVELELHVLKPATIPAGAPAVLSAEQADALIAAAEHLDHTRQTARIGQRTRLGSMGAIAALTDYDVEVAQRARAADPQVTILWAGTEIGAIASPRIGGGFYLRAWGRRAVPEAPPRRLALEHMAGAPIELPATASTLCAGSAMLDDGGAFLLRQDWNEGGAWLIRVRSVGPRPASSPFVPLGELTAVPLTVDPTDIWGAQPSGGWTLQAYHADRLGKQLTRDDPLPAYSSEEILERARNEQEEIDPDGSIALLHGALYVRGSDQLMARSSAVVEALGQALVGETVSVDVRLGLLEREQARLLTERASPEAIADQLTHRLLGAARLGDCMLLVGGMERFYLKDHEVEIAEGSCVDDPIIDALFEGVSFWCRMGRADRSGFTAWVDLQVSESLREMTRMPVAVWEPRNPEDGGEDTIPTGTFETSTMVELPATARAELSTMIGLAQGQWTLLCCTGLAGTDRALVAVMKAQ